MCCPLWESLPETNKYINIWNFKMVKTISVATTPNPSYHRYLHKFQNRTWSMSNILPCAVIASLANSNKPNHTFIMLLELYNKLAIGSCVKEHLCPLPTIWETGNNLYKRVSWKLRSKTFNENMHLTYPSFLQTNSLLSSFFRERKF